MMVCESSGIDVAPPDHVVDINDRDLMRAADVQQAVQAWHHGACAGNLDGRPLLHKVVLLGVSTTTEPSRPAAVLAPAHSHADSG